MNSAEIPVYKMKIIRKLIFDPDVVSLLDPLNEFEYPDDMIDKRIFPFDRIPGTQQEAMSFITISVNIPSIGEKNDIVKNVLVTIRAVSNTSLMKVDKKSGTRVDLLAARIDSLLNESQDFGIDAVELVSSFENALDENHFFRELKFQTMGLNNRRYGA